MIDIITNLALDLVIKAVIGVCLYKESVNLLYAYLAYTLYDSYKTINRMLELQKALKGLNALGGGLYEVPKSKKRGIDEDNDGSIDGYDNDGDGVIDEINKDGKE